MPMVQRGVDLGTGKCKTKVVVSRTPYLFLLSLPEHQEPTMMHPCKNLEVWGALVGPHRSDDQEIAVGGTERCTFLSSILGGAHDSSGTARSYLISDSEDHEASLWCSGAQWCEIEQGCWQAGMAFGPLSSVPFSLSPTYVHHYVHPFQ